MKKVKDNTSGEILIVDDVPENLQLLVSFLTAQGYQVRPASDGELALAAVKKRLPDLILLDIKMPDMDGFEVCRRLKADERTCNIPVIFISALSSLEDRLKGFAVGGLDYIIKPFEEVEVLARVKNHLQLYRMQEHLEDVVNERTQELKESEQQLQRARKMEAIGRLAGGIAHDFNNILSAILGFAELIIITKSSDSEVTEYAQQVITATNRAAHLVKQILSYSNKSNVTKELFQPHFVVEEAMKLLRTTLPKTLTIVEDIDPKSGSILANPMNIHQVVVNLCTNASQAMYKGKGTLSVALYKEKIDNTVIPADQQAEPGEYVTLSIRDTGCSIPEEDFENMFEPYFNTMKSRGSRGMGLAVVQSITWDSNGFIRVASQADQGTVITVSFPAKETPSEKNIPLDKEKSGGVISDSKENNSKEKILVVDDEELLIQINRKRLEQAGYTVEAFTDSNKALEIFRARPNSFNLLITDQTMPGLSGKELVKAVLEVKPSMPIIMCTGHSDSVSEKKALSMGIRKYITKPLHQHELREAVKELLASKPFSVDGI